MSYFLRGFSSIYHIYLIKTQDINLISVRYRNIILNISISYSPLGGFYCCTYYIYIYITKPTIYTYICIYNHIYTIYMCHNIISCLFKKLRNERKYTLTEFDIVTFLFTTSGSLYLFLWIQIVIQCLFLISVQLYSHLLSLHCSVRWFTFLYILGLTIAF